MPSLRQLLSKYQAFVGVLLLLAYIGVSYYAICLPADAEVDRLVSLRDQLKTRVDAAGAILANQAETELRITELQGLLDEYDSQVIDAANSSGVLLDIDIAAELTGVSVTVVDAAHDIAMGPYRGQSLVMQAMGSLGQQIRFLVLMEERAKLTWVENLEVRLVADEDKVYQADYRLLFIDGRPR